MPRGIGLSRRWLPTEKEVEHAGDKFMSTLGFSVWKLSQPRATMQTSGWPDRLYTHRAKHLSVFWEAKRPGGKQRTSQQTFEADVTACGLEYLCGTNEVLHGWAQARGLVTMLPSGGMQVAR